MPTPQHHKRRDCLACGKNVAIRKDGYLVAHLCPHGKDCRPSPVYAPTCSKCDAFRRDGMPRLDGVTNPTKPGKRRR